MMLPRPRFTMRWLMVAVAIVALGLGILAELHRRSARFAQIAWHHEIEADICSSTTKAQHHLDLTRRYQHAARYPWLPVAPDPPEPQ
jgi:hypothetical protein